MGKKSANKKKQQGKRPQQQASRPVSQPVAMRKEMDLQSLEGEYIAPEVKVAANPAKPLGLAEQASFVRGDIFRISILLAVVVLLLIVGAVVNAKTSLLHTAGQHLSHFLRLQ